MEREEHGSSPTTEGPVTRSVGQEHILTVATLGPAPSKERPPRQKGFLQHGGRGTGNVPPQAV